MYERKEGLSPRIAEAWTTLPPPVAAEVKEDRNAEGRAGRDTAGGRTRAVDRILREVEELPIAPAGVLEGNRMQHLEVVRSAAGRGGNSAPESRCPVLEDWNRRTTLDKDDRCREEQVSRLTGRWMVGERARRRGTMWSWSVIRHGRI